MPFVLCEGGNQFKNIKKLDSRTDQLYAQLCGKGLAQNRTYDNNEYDDDSNESYSESLDEVAKGESLLVYLCFIKSITV